MFVSQCCCSQEFATIILYFIYTYKGLSIYYISSYNKAGSFRMNAYERLPKGARVHSKAYVLWKSTLINEDINLTLTFSDIKSVFIESLKVSNVKIIPQSPKLK